ncbi:hypothetical protein [Leisingera caerulea]|uniref:Uncharacterized protein n=1 Tax=Leisingera caerulea TaxID=506591 RepID=A0A9Q9HN16_LEICA|nr:hypothetical protein [Leisingera caerulea]UWQ55107.1 hypothetical protein K3721_06110 [Leisingera caerulea]
MTEFLEELPVGCPPDDAEDGLLEEVWRFHQGVTPKPEHFFSHAKLGKNNHRNVCQCVFSSCSLFKTKRARQMAKLPFFKKKMASELKIPAKSGKFLQGRDGHVDFWMYTSFDPLASILRTEKL